METKLKKSFLISLILVMLCAGFVSAKSAPRNRYDELAAQLINGKRVKPGRSVAFLPFESEFNEKITKDITKRVVTAIYKTDKLEFVEDYDEADYICEGTIEPEGRDYRITLTLSRAGSESILNTASITVPKMDEPEPKKPKSKKKHDREPPRKRYDYDDDDYDIDIDLDAEDIAGILILDAILDELFDPHFFRPGKPAPAPAPKRPEPEPAKPPKPSKPRP